MPVYVLLRSLLLDPTDSTEQVYQWWESFTPKFVV